MFDWRERISPAAAEFDRLMGKVADGFAYVSVFCLIALTLVTTGQVIMRYVFNRPTMWADEMAAYLLLAIVFLGLAHTLREEAHIRIEILSGLLPARIRRNLEIVNYVIGILFSVFMLVAAYERVLSFWVRQTRSYSILLTPLYLPAIPLVVGTVVFILLMVSQFLCLVAPTRGRRGGPGRL